MRRIRFIRSQIYIRLWYPRWCKRRDYAALFCHLSFRRKHSRAKVNDIFPAAIMFILTEIFIVSTVFLLSLKRYAVPEHNNKYHDYWYSYVKKYSRDVYAVATCRKCKHDVNISQTRRIKPAANKPPPFSVTPANILMSRARATCRRLTREVP